jgi:hypothetical protein
VKRRVTHELLYVRCPWIGEIRDAENVEAAKAAIRKRLVFFDLLVGAAHKISNPRACEAPVVSRRSNHVRAMRELTNDA